MLETLDNKECVGKMGPFPPPPPSPLSIWVDVSVIHMAITSQASPSILRPGNEANGSSSLTFPTIRRQRG